jgi:superfamily I DNA/RNA helicase
MARRQIPFVKYGGLRDLKAAHLKDRIALFRLADNPRGARGRRADRPRIGGRA